MALSVQRATLNNDTPISGVELSPYVVTRKADGTSTTADIPESDPADGCHLRYRWFRSSSHRKASVCSVHPGEPAVLQNVHSKSYHCDESCLRRAGASGCGTGWPTAGATKTRASRFGSRRT